MKKKIISIVFLFSTVLYANDTKFTSGEDVLECNNNIVIDYKLILQEEPNLELYYLIQDLDDKTVYYEWDCTIVQGS